MDLKELNHAGEHAIFGSIEVLGDIDGKGMRTIRREINSMQQQQASFTRKIDNYWSDLSNDGIITPVEKTSLLKEWEGIAQSYTALYAQASEKQLTNTQYWLDYAAAYEALKTELFTTEKIFDNMYENTTLSDKDAFDSIFSEYYYEEKFVTLAITAGLIDKLGLRALTSLQEEGTDGELAFYHGELYQYVEDTWVKIGTETYLGIVNQMSDLPEIKQEGQYFIAGQVFPVMCPLVINNKILEINGKILMIKYLDYAAAGQILYWHNNRWNLAADDDPRYIAVLADYYKATGGMPALFAEEVQKVSGNESYVGVYSTAPANPKKNFYFLYSGITAGDWVHARIYKYNGTLWEEMDPADDGESKYYMNALQDILLLEEAGSGYFSTLFCNAFFTNKASINALKVQTIYLNDNGNIQSEKDAYIPGVQGLLIDAKGNIDANGTTHIGGTCTIDGNTTIGGICNVDKLHFNRSYNPSDTGFVNGDVWMVTI